MREVTCGDSQPTGPEENVSMLTRLVNQPPPAKTNRKWGAKRPQPDKFRTPTEFRNGNLAR